MGVLSLCWRGSRRQALRTLRKGLDMLRRRKHGTTDRLALPHQHRPKGEIAETVRSAPGRDPRMARFIRILTGMARETGRFLRPYRAEPGPASWRPHRLPGPIPQFRPPEAPWVTKTPLPRRFAWYMAAPRCVR